MRGLLLSAPHWLFEVISGVLFGVLGYPISKRFLRKHDDRHHPDRRLIAVNLAGHAQSELLQRIERLEAVWNEDAVVNADLDDVERRLEGLEARASRATWDDEGRGGL